MMKQSCGLDTRANTDLRAANAVMPDWITVAALGGTYRAISLMNYPVVLAALCVMASP
jgi:hypothetical protein